MNAPVTAGGITVGLAILAWHGMRWWHANKGTKAKNWRALIPLGYGIVLGILGSACAGGLIGGIFNRVRAASNGTGEKVLNGATGATSATATAAHLPALTMGGAILVVLAFTALIALWKKLGRDEIRQIGAGAVSGATLGTSAGVAGSGALALLPLINSIGDSLLNSI
ncbi:hypothetical protein RKE29_02100 [Streptomyces sp. B1866]|uniref:hypothetical protein n=1 Tax=Streptomyces sp. B1866 TaxID=3075431 RepID=UPI00288EDB65|nr:hypothetical protein [Streptomyces sp. B1866]MDT3395453.1 hypothetical protein [Streptomyces sp. B1866]